MDIKIDDLSGGEVVQLLEEHLTDMYAISPPESVHALDVDSLKSPDVTFFSGWVDGELMGCVAIKALTPTHIELKSMRTVTHARRSGVARQLLSYALRESEQRGYQQMSLETGSQDDFKAARHLYEQFGFNYCAPFADYQADPNSKFMTLFIS
ncbi:GNAT family N-acetyltransferase [Vibrio sp. FNV 38]|nr:GNAT family N-acetyltransferase [Vibrio sp. FNV 38]